MTYVDYLRRVRVRAVSHEWPWLCSMAGDAANACTGADRSAAAEHRHRLLRTIKAQLRGHTFLSSALREMRHDWPYAGADGKAIRIAWLDEQIAQAEAACTPT